MIKKWITRGTEKDGGDSFFTTRTAAREKARKVLISGKKNVVRIGKLSEEKCKDKHTSLRKCYIDVESWGWIAPRMMGHMIIHHEV